MVTKMAKEADELKVLKVLIKGLKIQELHQQVKKGETNPNAQQKE